MSYQRTSEASVQSRETESAAFKLVTRDLEAALTGPERIRALGRNHLLWSLLVKDMSLAENKLPAGLKEQLTSLGLWSMRYSTLAVLNNLPVEPLVAVNRNILAGIAGQPSETSDNASRLLPTEAV